MYPYMHTYHVCIQICTYTYTTILQYYMHNTYTHSQSLTQSSHTAVRPLRVHPEIPEAVERDAHVTFLSREEAPWSAARFDNDVFGARVFAMRPMPTTFCSHLHVFVEGLEVDAKRELLLQEQQRVGATCVLPLIAFHGAQRSCNSHCR